MFRRTLGCILAAGVGAGFGDAGRPAEASLIKWVGSATLSIGANTDILTPPGVNPLISFPSPGSGAGPYNTPDFGAVDITLTTTDVTPHWIQIKGDSTASLRARAESPFVINGTEEEHLLVLIQAKYQVVTTATTIARLTSQGNILATGAVIDDALLDDLSTATAFIKYNEPGAGAEELADIKTAVYSQADAGAPVAATKGFFDDAAPKSTKIYDVLIVIDLAALATGDHDEETALAGWKDFVFDIKIYVIPEPASAVLAALGLPLLLGAVRRGRMPRRLAA